MNWMKKLLGMTDREETIKEREEEIERQPPTVQPPRSPETVRILLADIEGKVRDYRTKHGRAPRELVMSKENLDLLGPHLPPGGVPVRAEGRFGGFEVR